MCLAIPAQIKSIHKDTCVVDFGGVRKKVSLGIISKVKEGDYVLVHAGFAIGKVEKQEAQETLKIFRELEKAIQDEKQ